jgi:thiamine-phosphate pyrophosphorylase
MRGSFESLGLPIQPGSKQIISLEAGPEVDTLALRDRLEERGVFGAVFCAPATSRNRSMVRLTLNSGLTDAEMDRVEGVAREMFETTRSLVESLPVPVIVNDRFDVALAAGAAGVHLGADDLPVAAVRSAVPRDFIIGASAGNDEEARTVAGADYVGIGPVFGSASKLDAGPAIGVEEFRRLMKLIGLPAVAVGGITATNAREIFEAGGTGVAVIRAIFADSDPEAAARSLAAATGT